MCVHMCTALCMHILYYETYEQILLITVGLHLAFVCFVLFYFMTYFYAPISTNTIVSGVL